MPIDTAASIAPPIWSEPVKAARRRREESPRNRDFQEVRVVRLSDGQVVSVGDLLPEGALLNAACWLPDSKGLLVTATGTAQDKGLLLGTAPGINLP